MDKKISIIIPVFNEEDTLEKVLRRVFEVPIAGYQKEVIVINDGSKDNSNAILNDLRKIYPFVYTAHPRNLGKGAALRTGFKLASGDIILIQDADLEYDPTEWELLIKEFADPTARVIYGSRNIHPERQGYRHYVLGVWLLTKTINILYRSNLTDAYTCYKAFRQEVLQIINFRSNGFEIEAEITAKILKRKIPIKEVAISYNPRKFSQGKKICFWDGIKGLWTILFHRF